MINSEGIFPTTYKNYSFTTFLLKFYVLYNLINPLIFQSFFKQSNQTNYNQKMSIIYSVIVRTSSTGDITTLCSYDAAHGNYPTITQQILKSIKITDSMNYKYNEQYNYYIVKDSNVLYVCLAESSLKVKSAVVFLEEIKKRFKEKFSQNQITTAGAFDMNATFAQIYKQQFTFFNSNKDQDKKDQLIKQLQNLQGMMNDNIQKVLQREQRVQMLVKKTQKLDTIAQQIKKNASKIKKQAFWSKYKCKLLMILCVLGASGGAFLII